jgi:tetratricopeptide (TPR) repeat protein
MILQEVAKGEKTMKTKYSMGFLSVVIFLSGCASMQTASEVNSGRQAFIIGNNEAANAYFRSAAQKDPNYVYGTALRQGIWSYVGRSEYAVGRFPEARQALDRALSANNDENLARLYLGLTLARTGDRQKGLQEIEGGLKGMQSWLDYITETHRYSFGRFWDPGNELRSAIRGDLAMISGRDLDWQKLITESEWLGKKFEEESDLARRQESLENSRDGGGRDSQP